MTIPTRPEAGQPFRIVGGVLGASARLWWRRLRSSIGTVASILLVVVLGLAAPAFWWGIWPVFAPTLRGIINANERIAELCADLLTDQGDDACFRLRVEGPAHAAGHGSPRPHHPGCCPDHS